MNGDFRTLSHRCTGVSTPKYVTEVGEGLERYKCLFTSSSLGRYSGDREGGENTREVAC